MTTGKEWIDSLWIMIYSLLLAVMGDVFLFLLNVQWTYSDFPPVLNCSCRIFIQNKQNPKTPQHHFTQISLILLQDEQSEHPICLLLCRWHSDRGHLTSLAPIPCVNMVRILFNARAFYTKSFLHCSHPPCSPSPPLPRRPSICDCSLAQTLSWAEQRDVDVVLSVHMIATWFGVHLMPRRMESTRLHFPPLPPLPLFSFAVYIVD